jgi:hypothetical protein
MRQTLLLALFSAATVWAGTITTATCDAGAASDSQTNQSSATCSAQDANHGDYATANGTVAIGTLTGFTDVSSGECCPVATVFSSFDASFTQPTTVNWTIEVDVSGPWAYVSMELGPLGEYYTSSWAGTITQDLQPGSYTFSAYAYVSDQGSASFTADPPISEAPEPGTISVVFGIALIWIGARRRRTQ